MEFGPPPPEVAVQKREMLLQMLDAGVVMVHIDPRLESVNVPDFLRVEPTLRLNIAYGFRLPALDISEEGVYTILSFNRVDQVCDMPWDAIFAFTSPGEGQMGVMWPASCPIEVQLGLGANGVPITWEPLHLPNDGGAPAPPVAIAAAKKRPAPAPAPAVKAVIEDVLNSVPAPPKPAPAIVSAPRFAVHEGGGEGSNADDAADGDGDGDGPREPPKPRPALRLVKG